MLNLLLREANIEVFKYGRILADTAVKLMACGCEVERLELRLIRNLATLRQ